MKLSLRGRARQRGLRLLFLLAAIALGACGGRQAQPSSAVYVRARAVADPPPPAPIVVRVPIDGPQQAS